MIQNKTMTPGQLALLAKQRDLAARLDNPIWTGRKRSSAKGWRPADTSGYLMKHGTLLRDRPKRDMSISARQWKRQERRLRRAAKEAD